MSQAPQPPMQPPPSSVPEPVSQGPEDEAPVGPPFVAILPGPAPARSSRTPLIVFGVCVVALIGGIIFTCTRPDSAEAEPTATPVSAMTAAELGEDASMPAARELVRRMLQGTSAEHAEAARVMNAPRTPRLARNLAMAMALAQQKRANDMRLRNEREIRMYEQGQ